MSTQPTPPYSVTPSGAAGASGAVFLAAYLASLPSPHSKRNMARNADIAAHILSNGHQTAEEFQWSSLTYIHLVGLVDALSQRYNPNTVNNILSAVKGLLKTAWLAGAMPNENYQRAIAAQGVTSTPSLRGRHVPADQVRDVLNAALDISVTAPRRSARDYAILCLGFGAGLRRSEIADLDVWDYDGATGRLQIKRAKGRKDRVTFANSECRRAMLAWLNVRQAADVTDTPAAFVQISHDDTPHTDGRITSQTVYNVFGKYGKKAGLVGLTPHDARRTYIGTALDAGVPELVISAAVGHASADTTRRYDRRGERAISALADKITY